jgi:hypothetical protein
VFVYDGTVTMMNTQIVRNTATGYYFGGGGVHIWLGTVTMMNTQIISNTASYFGGGVYVNSSSATLTASGGEIRGNTANYFDGGGVYVDFGTATMTNTQIISNTANQRGGGVYIGSGSARLSVGAGPIANNVAPSGSGVFQRDGVITPTTSLTITGQVYQAGGVFAGSSYDLCIEGALYLAGGDFYAPDAPADFALTGPFTHTGGVYHQTQDVSGSSDVGFPKAGGVIINAGTQNLGSTEVALTAGADCAGAPTGETVHHCYLITPTNTTGQDATLTFYYRNDEVPAGHACTTMNAYRWDGTWDNQLTRDTSYGADGRMCGDDPQSIQTMNVATFSPFAFVLNGPAETQKYIYLPLVVRNHPSGG